MSKARQRRETIYWEGYYDAKRGKPYKWQRHPYLAAYRAGWRKAKGLSVIADNGWLRMLRRYAP